LIGPCPEAALGVEDEAELILVLAARPAEVDTPEGGGVAVGEGGELLAVALQRGVAGREVAVSAGEADAGT